MLPDDLHYVEILEKLFGRKLDDVRILTLFICDFDNRVTFGHNVFINHSAILSASNGINFEDGVMSHQDYALQVSIMICMIVITRIHMCVTICLGVTIGKYAIVDVGAVVIKDVSD